MLLTYDIVRREPACLIKEEHCFSPTTLADWGQFCRETMLLYMEGCNEKIGGPYKTVEIDESKFGNRKYNRGHPVKGQWVFGGVERESGKTFLVPVPDRTADTLMAVIVEWIEPGTTVIRDCWGAYRDLETQGYTHRTVNHSIEFVDQRNGAHTNTIESTWRHVNAYLNPYNRKGDYIYHLAHYMFVAKCRAEKVRPFTKFLHLVATTDWNLRPPAPAESCAEFSAPGQRTS
jgi:transposase-like protein